MDKTRNSLLFISIKKQVTIKTTDVMEQYITFGKCMFSQCLGSWSWDTRFALIDELLLSYLCM